MGSHIDRQFNRVYISVKDMERCVEFAAAAEGVTELIIQRALITAAIVSYARPFSGNRNHEKAEATPPLSSLNLTAEERVLHDRLCKIRNQAIAHSDFEMNPSRPVEYHNTGFLVSSRIYDPLAEILNIRIIRALAQKVKTELENKLFDLARVAVRSSNSGS